MPSEDDGAAVPTGRAARLLRFGGIATGIAGGVAAGGLRALAQGKRPDIANLLLTPANTLRLTDGLSHLARGRSEAGADAVDGYRAGAARRVDGHSRPDAGRRASHASETAADSAERGMGAGMVQPLCPLRCPPLCRGLDRAGASRGLARWHGPCDQGAVSRCARQHRQRCGQRGHASAPAGAFAARNGHDPPDGRGEAPVACRGGLSGRSARTWRNSALCWPGPRCSCCRSCTRHCARRRCWR